MLCETKRGCPVGDIAPNEKAEQLVTGFIQAKSLYVQNGLPEVQRSILQPLGLLDDPDLLLQFENVWIEFQIKQRKAAAAANKRRK